MIIKMLVVMSVSITIVIDKHIDNEEDFFCRKLNLEKKIEKYHCLNFYNNIYANCSANLKRRIADIYKLI